MATSSTPPLGIFVLWHPFFKEGQEYADLIFSEFKRDVKSPLARGLNIPVYFRYLTPLLEIPFDKFEFTVTVAFIDSAFVLDNDYKEFLVSISQHHGKSLLIPFAIDSTAFNVGLGNANFARLYERTLKKEYVVSIIAHETARHLYELKEVIDPTDRSPKPLKLFISHAKADGLEIARQIKSYIDAQLPLKTFFDTNDISIGYDFTEEIKNNIAAAVVIALHTDQYSSREWCRREILLAKQNNRPIVILNCFQKGESRSFPYMANVLTIHYADIGSTGCQDKHVWEQLITAVLKETLRLKYLELWLEYIGQKKRPGHTLNKESISGYPPELVTVLRKKSKLNGEFIYPDPPLGTEELEILHEFDSTIKFLTPTDL
jgi:hypothetical protein